MTNSQAAEPADSQRDRWAKASLKGGKGDIPGRWYAVNSREQIRDNSIRYALLPVGAMVQKGGLPTTSSAPRYAIARPFSALLDPAVRGSAFDKAAEAWRAQFLTPAALARTKILAAAGHAAKSPVVVNLPGVGQRQMSAGMSSVITKGVVENFAPRFLAQPAIVWISESSNKVVQADMDLATSVGLRIDPARGLPDIILADVGPQHAILLFVEVVATDGPIDPTRKAALFGMASDFPRERILLLTAFADRDDGVFRAMMVRLAPGTLAWCLSEPDLLIELRDCAAVPLQAIELLRGSAPSPG